VPFFRKNGTDSETPKTSILVNYDISHKTRAFGEKPIPIEEGFEGKLTLSVLSHFSVFFR
jgi:hypothetical protein